MNYESVIGLEIHTQLKTNSKLFCSCTTKFGNEPNTNTCPVCSGQPGVLPVLNKKAVEFAIKTGLALNCKINSYSKFDRKNYFYPDLPKNFQTSQFDKPVCYDGFIDIEVDGKLKKIGITRIHLEEDAGKLVHSSDNFSGAESSLADYNRCGVPLLEIVSEPDITTEEEAYAYMHAIKNILSYIEVSDCNMEEGSLRCDANISIRPSGEKKLGTKVEIKNMNSFKNVKDGLAYEIKRQIKAVSNNEKIIQQTRLWDPKNNITVAMRSKEDSHDYRYFPEPDLMPIEISDELIKKIKTTIVELPLEKKNRFIKEYDLPYYDADVLTSDRHLADYFEKVANECSNYKSISNWLMTEMLGKLNENKKKINDSPISPLHFASLINLIDTGKISGKIAKDVFVIMFDTGKKPEVIVEEKGLVQVSDENLIEKTIKEVISENPDAVENYKNGKKQAIGFLMGQIMKKTRGKANPKLANKILLKNL